MIALSITAEAYRAIKATLPDGADSLPPQPDGRGGVRLWLATEFVNRIGGLRGPSKELFRCDSATGKGRSVAHRKAPRPNRRMHPNKPRGSGHRSTAGPTRSGPFGLALHAPDNQTRRIGPVKRNCRRVVPSAHFYEWPHALAASERAASDLGSCSRSHRRSLLHPIGQERRA
jgi:hypothetical protein